MYNFRIGDKVKTKESYMFGRYVGKIVAFPKRDINGGSQGVAVYCGGYESKYIPLSDLILIEG